MRRSVLLLCLLALLAGGCRTRAIPEPERIPVPRGLSQRNVEVAILSALLNRPPPGVYETRSEMAAEEYEKLVWNYYLTTASNRGWVVDGREPGGITAHLSRDHYSLRVRVQYDAEQAQVSIVESSGLRQSAGRIHRKAVGWVRKLEVRVRRQLERMALRRGPSP